MAGDSLASTSPLFRETAIVVRVILRSSENRETPGNRDQGRLSHLFASRPINFRLRAGGLRLG